MSISTTNGNLDPYRRRAAWEKGLYDIRGEQLTKPLLENFQGKGLERMERIMENFDNKSWITRETRYENEDYYMWVEKP